VTDSERGTEEYFDLSLSEESASYYYLILSLDANSIEAAWFHTTKKLITGFARYPASQGVKGVLEQHPHLASEFKEVIVSFRTPNYLVYPKHLVEGSALEVFSLTNTTVEEGEDLLQFPLVNLSADIAFPVPSHYMTAVFDAYPHVKLIPHVAPRIEYELNQMRERSAGRAMMVCHIWADYVDIRAYRDDGLLMANTYFQSGKEDVAYFVLYAAEQLGINPHEGDLEISGNIQLGDEAWTLLSKYWNRMAMASPLSDINISDALSDYPSPQFDFLTHSLLCVS
jgi:hypothetical protein